MSRSYYGSYRWTCTLFALKRSYCCLFRPSRGHWGARKAAVTSKWCQNSWTNRFQRKPHDKNLENCIKNSMTPCFRHINEVCSRIRGNRLIQTHTERLPYPSRMCRGLIMGHDSNMHSLPQDAGKAWKIGNDIHTLGCGAAHTHRLHEASSGHTTCSRP